MVKYDDIETHFQEYLDDSDRHLFIIGDVKVMFWPMRGHSWRIVTDLSIEECEAIANDLNEQSTYPTRIFEAQEAWQNIRPKYMTPPMTSQIVGSIRNMDMLDRIWAAIHMLSFDPSANGSSDIPNRTVSVIKRLSQSVETPSTPKGHSMEDIIDRLSTAQDTSLKPHASYKNDSDKSRVIRRRIISGRTVNDD